MGIQWRLLWIESLALSNTLTGRDKSMRFWQYLFRFLKALTGHEIFHNARNTLSISRKTLRFYGEVRMLKNIEDTLHDNSLDTIDRTLTICEHGSNFVYICLDHIAFLERIGGLKFLTPKQVENFDRFIECFWGSEALAVLCRELRTYSRIQASKSSQVSNVPGPITSQALTGIDKHVQTVIPVPQLHVPRPLSKRRSNLLKLLKACCDIPCAMLFLQPAGFQNKRVHQIWCGILGMMASLISLHVNWPERA